jgi:branched-chain amino acid transport system ATP-binding protein
MAVLLAEQNAQMALSVADRGYVMQSGRVTTEARAQDLLASNEVRTAFMGM